jgi:RimJ/RimL family protein N-acetyltransferase
VRLTGGKIVLRDKQPEDAWMDYLWRSDKEISRLDAAIPLKMTFQEFLRLFKDQLQYPTPASGRFSIEAVDGKYIGTCMYYDLDTVNKQAEIGIVIGDREYWGRTYGYDAVVTLLDYLFSGASVERLYLHTLDWNKRAQRAFEKCGFTPVRSVRRNGMDFVLMEIEREYWLEVREQKLAARDAGAGVRQE